MNSRPPRSLTNQWTFPCIACSLESILSLLLVAFLASSHWLSTWGYPLTRSQVASNWLSLSCPALGLLLPQSWDILRRVLSVPDLLSALQSLQHSTPSTAMSKTSRSLNLQHSVWQSPLLIIYPCTSLMLMRNISLLRISPTTRFALQSGHRPTISVPP